MTDRFNRTQNILEHLRVTADTLKQGAEQLEREIARIQTFEEAESLANTSISRLAFVYANAMSSLGLANHWADEHRQMEILGLKEQKNVG